MESAEAPTDNLHKSVGTSLEKLGHHTPTIPPNEGPVLAEDVRGMAEDLGYNAKTALEEAINGVEISSRDRVSSKNPISIVLERAKRVRDRFRKAA